MKHYELGIWGEDFAIKYLLDKGYKILHKNWHSGKLEIDVICQKENNTIIIVEVKTRNSAYFGDPQDFVTPSKRKNLITAADAFITKNNIDAEVRFDIIAILKNKYTEKLTHIKDAFLPF